MSTDPTSLIRSLAATPGIVVVEEATQRVLRLDRSPVEVVVTVPVGVLEWFVDAHDTDTGATASDWCDYTGYDDRRREELERDIAEDLHLFIDDLRSRPLRMTPASPGGAAAVLWWQVDGEWQPSVPLGAGV